MNGLMTEENCGDLVIECGGCVVAGAEQQTIEHVLVANRGEWREWPLLGGEVRRMQHGIAARMWAARERWGAAGVAVKRVTVGETGKIKVE